MESFTHNVWEMDLIAQLVNLVFFYLLTFLCFMLLGTGRRAVYAVAALALIVGTANYFVMEFRGNPILPWDLKSLSVAASVAGNYEFTISSRAWMVFISFALIFFAAWFIRLRAPKKKRMRGGILLPCLLLIFGLNNLLHIDAVTENLLPGGFLFTQWATYRDNGFAVSFMMNLKYLDITEPDGYSLNQVETSMEKFSALPATSQTTVLERQNPNIIVIMNEAFSDLSVLGDFEPSEDYMPFIHSLNDSSNAITGWLHTSVVGGNTANTEFEFLTGNTMAFLPAGSVPYQQYITEPLPSVASILKEQGYTTIAMHPYYATGWNRDKVYPLLGFDTMYFRDSFKNPEILRTYVSDRSTYQKIIDCYEEKDSGESLFIFDVTMQNHSGYSDRYDNFVPQITVDALSGSHPATEQYLSLVQESDKAFQELTEYFQDEEDTIILMFGDHQPTDFIADCILELNGKDREEMTQEEIECRYIVPFVMWANFDLAGSEDEEIEISVNYLSSLLFETAGLNTSDYQDYLSGLSEILPVVTANGYMDAEGNFYTYKEETEYSPLLNQYSQFQYNNLFDETYDAFFE